ncbi:MAG: DUF4136 domain-containing protein [Flavobacteriaceae bacterium]|nr:DUF4136 domain-containing protein [Flavobacteriaceae bacterium]
MKRCAVLFLTLLFFISCTSIKVVTDYDSKTDFSQYKTFAFYKKGIDKAKISDIDKRRILRAIEVEMLAKGYQKSENPDVLISIFTKSRKKVNVDKRFYYPNYYWYPPYYFERDRIRITKHTEGTLFIDFIDKDAKKLIWQGIGSGTLRSTSGYKKRERIQLFVKEILKNYPLEKETK